MSGIKRPLDIKYALTEEEKIKREIKKILLSSCRVNSAVRDLFILIEQIVKDKRLDKNGK